LQRRDTPFLGISHPPGQLFSISRSQCLVGK
jgi:hypothetical protein